MKNLPKPLPCPFCGSRVEPDEGIEGEWSFTCVRGCCTQNKYYSSRRAAVRAWNRRAVAAKSKPAEKGE